MNAAPLRAEALATLARTLRLSARAALTEASVAQHLRRRSGASRVFREHRPYVPGDDVRQLDWRAFARTGRPAIKRFEDEARLQLWVGLDAGPSVRFGNGGSHKLLWLAVLAQALFELAARQDDAAGLFLLRGGAGEWRPQAGANQPKRMAAALSAALQQAAGTRDDLKPPRSGPVLRGHPPARVILLGDWLSDEGNAAPGGSHPQLEAQLRRYRALGHPVDVVHVLHPAEADFPFAGEVTFSAGKDHAPTKTNASAVRSNYLAALAAFQTGLRNSCMRQGARLWGARTDASVASVLTQIATFRSPQARVSGL